MAETGGQKISGSTKIPVAEMARDNLDKIFPHLTKDQVEAIKAGKPVPPSPDWDALTDQPKSSRGVRDDSDVKRIQELNQKLDESVDLLRTKVRTEGVFAGFTASMRHMPLVSCVLVFSDKNRVRRARRAVNQFVAQSYPNKQIVIVNTTDLPITNVAHAAIKEVGWESSVTPTTGAMRNYALTLCDGDVVCPHWDDDDVYDPNLLAYMMQNYQTGRGVLLSTTIRVDIKNSTAYLHTQPDGIPNTMLVPKTDAAYPDKTGGEDVAFWNRHWGMKSVVVDNRAWPVNTLKMCVFDGNNVLTAEQFMVNHSSPDLYGRWELGVNEVEHMKAVLATFGLKTEPKMPTQDTQPAAVMA